MIDTKIFISRIRDFRIANPHESIKLSDLFADNLDQNGKLLLNNIDFYRVDSVLSGFDFNNCVISNSNFNNLVFQECDFSHSLIEDNNAIEHIHILACINKGVNFLPDQWSKHILYLDTEPDGFQAHSGIEVRNRINAHFHWTTQQWQQHPEDFFKYDALEKHISSVAINSIEKRDGWYHLTKPILNDIKSVICKHFGIEYQPDEDVDYYGWKLHLSVKSSHDIAQIFNLSAPIISRYCPRFKVADVTTIPDNGSNSKQMTIYLQRNGQSLVSPENVEKMIREVSSALMNSDILPGQYPDSDAATFSPYFSIRNDLFLQLKNHNLTSFRSGYSSDSEEENPPAFNRIYLNSDICNFNYNPCNEPNPFISIINQPNNFNLFEHFKSLFLKEYSLRVIQGILAISILAFLREYTFIADASLSQWAGMAKNYFNTINDINNEFIRPPYCNEAKSKATIRKALLIFMFLSDRDSQLTESDIPLLCLEGDDIFTLNMQKITEVLQGLSRQDELFHGKNFSDFMEEVSQFEIEEEKSIEDNHKEYIASTLQQVTKYQADHPFNQRPLLSEESAASDECFNSLKV